MSLDLPAAALLRPWRSAAVGWGVAAVALVLSVPLFLRSPPWCDLTLYELAARNLLAGGVHYHDVFDTNTPGFVWALAGVRAVVGPSWEAVKAVDLAIVAGITGLLVTLARHGGAASANRAWLVAGVAVLYPSLPEPNHCQRDVWMLLPALAAALIRLRGTEKAEGGAIRSALRLPPSAVAEGVLWGLAVWVKPHVVVPAAAVWLATVRRESWGRDLAGNLIGGLVAGVIGIGCLVVSGTWPYFVEVFTVWNTGYAAKMWNELPVRYEIEFHYFPPWSYLHLLALPVAVLTLADDWWPVTQRLPGWLWAPPADGRQRAARVALAALYLGWTAQALYLQRQMHYVHVPEVLLLLALLAAHRWAVVPLAVGWLAVVPLLSALPPDLSGAGALPGNDAGWKSRHPLTDPGRLELWPDCLRPTKSDQERAALWDRLAQVRGFHAAATWTELDELAAELRRRGVRDGELLCWDDSPHALYLLLGRKPGFRFLHVNQMREIGPDQDARLMAELCQVAPRVRWVAADLLYVCPPAPNPSDSLAEAGPDKLPRWPNAAWRANFPYYLPAVSGPVRATGGMCYSRCPARAPSANAVTGRSRGKSTYGCGVPAGGRGGRLVAGGPDLRTSVA